MIDYTHICIKIILKHYLRFLLPFSFRIMTFSAIIGKRWPFFNIHICSESFAAMYIDLRSVLICVKSVAALFRGDFVQNLTKVLAFYLWHRGLTLSFCLLEYSASSVAVDLFSGRNIIITAVQKLETIEHYPQTSITWKHVDVTYGS